MKNLAVLFGGESTEHEVSDVSAAFVADNASEKKYNLYKIGITSDGLWFLYKGSTENMRNHTWQDDKENLLPCIISPCKAHHGMLVKNEKGEWENVRIDAAFPVLHGKNGEDGTIQGLFALAGIPYVGCDTCSSACCMNKSHTKKLAAESKVKTANWIDLIKSDGFNMNDAVAAAEEKLGYPIFVKPANLGSSVGITKAADRKALIKGIEEGFKYDNLVLLEENIVGKEIECAVLTCPDGKIVSECGEIKPNSDFYDYDTKYINDSAEYYIPARIDEKTANEVRNAASVIFDLLGCRGLSRVDFFVTDKNEVYFNEINTIPGFTPISMYPQLMKRAGYDCAALLDALIEDACGR